MTKIEMTLTEYKSLDWQERDEAFFEFCELNELDHTDPDSRDMFFNMLVLNLFN